MEVGASTGGASSRLKRSLDVVVGGAESLGVAGEDGELDIDIALASRNGLVEFLDVATSVVGTEVVDGDVVQTEETNIHSAVEVGSPDAVARGVVTAGEFGVVVALLRTALVDLPVPIAILVEVAVGFKFVLVLALSGAHESVGVPLAASEVEASILGGEDLATFDTVLGGGFPVAGGVGLALGLDGVIAALACAVSGGGGVGVVDPAAAFVIKALIVVEVAADLGHAVVTTVVPFAIRISFALGFVLAVAWAEAAFKVADEGGQRLLDVAHGIRSAVRPVVGLEGSTSTRAHLGAGPLIPDATVVLSGSALTISLSQVGELTTAEALLVGGQRGVGLELAGCIHVAGSFVGTVGGANTSAAVVDTVPGAAVGILGER